MPTPPLMSERNEPNSTTWFDCWIASGMMAAWKSGYRGFPLGWTVAEREALERTTGKTPETGGNVDAFDVGTKARYGFVLEQVSTSLPTLLGGPKTAGFMVAGKEYLLPAYLRRWDPAFTDNHMVYVEPTGDGRTVRWLDPLAPWGYLGDIVAISVVNAFNLPLGVGNVRRAREGTHGYRLGITKYPTPKLWTVKAGQRLNGYDPNKPGGPVLTALFEHASAAYADAEVVVSWPGYLTTPVPHGGPFLRVTGGSFKGLLIVKAFVSVAP